MEKSKSAALKAYTDWPFISGIVLVLATIGGWIIQAEIGEFLAMVTAAYYLAAGIIHSVHKKVLAQRLVDFGAAYAEIQNQLLRQVEIPFVMIDGIGRIYWSNPAFLGAFHPKKTEQMIFNLFPTLEKRDFSKERFFEVSFGEREYAISVDPLNMQELQEFPEMGNGTAALYNMYLTDETDLKYYKKTLEEERAVVSLIYFDNYDEVMEGVENVRRSLLDALLERKLSKYVENYHGVLRKLEKDRFILFLSQKSLFEMQEDKFSLLEDIKTVSIGNEMAMTLSIGIGMGAGFYDRNYEFAQAAIDMALGRGGDQVVVKNGTEITYFGGKAHSTERNTRVKARIKAHALRDLIEEHENVLIMGHPLSDMDCIGAAIGIYAAAKYSGKKAQLILNERTTSVQPLLDLITSSSDYPPDIFINSEKALSLCTEKTLVVVVDTNRPSYTACPELLEQTDQVVVMDHHRQGRETVGSALLSYIEPFASSASEMVAEMVQYYADDLKLKPLEAEIVYAGIVMDTNNFEDKAGVRTFEAAAYLRRCGTDVSHVRKLFRGTMEDYMLRAETLRRAELYLDDYIISICPNDGKNSNQTVVAAQAANELLSIRDVKASFVLTEYEGKIYLSARSIDEVNVQLICEKLGGGGHLSVAGAQFTDITIEEALERLKKTLAET